MLSLSKNMFLVAACIWPATRRPATSPSLTFVSAALLCTTLLCCLPLPADPHHLQQHQGHLSAGRHEGGVQLHALRSAAGGATHLQPNTGENARNNSTYQLPVQK
jgi:hypothetical protein